MQRKRPAPEYQHHVLVEAKLASFQDFYAPSSSWVVELPALLALVRPAGFSALLFVFGRSAQPAFRQPRMAKAHEHWDLGERDKQLIRYTMFRPA